jgi:hypothetical protein
MTHRTVHRFTLNPTSLSGNCQWCDYPEAHENHDKPTQTSEPVEQAAPPRPLRGKVVMMTYFNGILKELGLPENKAVNLIHAVQSLRTRAETAEKENKELFEALNKERNTVLDLRAELAAKTEPK